ncbi:MAG: OmpA family protein [Microbacterium sp.]
MARIWRLVAAATAATLLLTGCSEADDPSPTNAQSSSAADALATIPVQASYVFYGTPTGEYPFRFSLIDVRRIEGGTVLDYALTALPFGDVGEGESTFGLDTADFDFDGEGNAPDISLLDIDGEEIYYPRAEYIGGHCPCTRPYFGGFEIGETQLHQVAYPELPEDLTTVTVNFGNGPLVEDVPVLEEGTVPVAAEPFDFRAPAEPLPSPASTGPFDQPIVAFSGEESQPAKISVNAVLAGEDATTLVWSVEATGDGDGIGDFTIGSPMTDPVTLYTVGMYRSFSANGPGLRPSGDEDAPVMRTWVSTMLSKPGVTQAGIESADYRRCLCTEYSTYALDLDSAGDARVFTTKLPALPEGTETVDVVFPDDALPALTDVPVTEAVTATDLETTTVTVQTWTDTDDLVNSATYAPEDWPIPVPSVEALSVAEPYVDRLTAEYTLGEVDKSEQQSEVELRLDSTISFKADSAKLTAKASTLIETVAEQINADAVPGSIVHIDGYVADTGTNHSIDQSLSAARAEAVAKALSPLLDVDVTLKAEGHGTDDPIGDNSTEAGRALNRRVEVSFTATTP